MPERNRVTPFGEIVSIEQRGLFMGNRGSIHRGRTIVRSWQVRRWITCVLEFKGWLAPKWEPGRWTPLFFWDEAVALAAGHRPCALCRRRDYKAWLDAWASAFGDRPSADAMDRRLHAERLEVKTHRRHRKPWHDLPIGAFVALDDVPALMLDDRLVPWSAAGYGTPIDRPTRGDATVLTPPSTIAVLEQGYRSVIHPTVDGRPSLGGPADGRRTGSRLNIEGGVVEKQPEQPKETGPQETESPPPFAPDPDIVTLRERGAKDPKQVWRETSPKTR